MENSLKCGQYEDLSPSLSSFEVGMWRIIYEHHPRKLVASWSDDIAKWKSAIQDQYLIRLIVDIYHLGPALFIFCVVARLLRGFEEASTIYLSNKLIALIEHGLASGTPDRLQILVLVGARVLMGNALSWWRSFTAQIDPILSSRIKLYFEERAMEAHVDADYSSSNSQNFDVAPPSAWSTLYAILEAVDAACAMFSQLWLVVSMAGARDGGWTLMLVCFAKVFTDMVMVDHFRPKSYIIQTVNPVYLRMRALYTIATEYTYRRELISGAFGHHLVDEYRHARQTLGDISDEVPYDILPFQRNWANKLFADSIEHLPITFIAVKAILDPRHASLSSFTMTEQVSFSLRHSVSRLSYVMANLYRSLESTRTIYARIDAHEARLKANSNKLRYPLPDKKEQRGMEIEFRNVSFRYPGSDENKLALDGVNFSIKPSSLVIIVGENGSGKTSIANLLSGFYQPTGGEILLDGVNASEYRPGDLREATALLTQEYTLLPLSISENIALGDPYDISDDYRLHEASSLGGSLDLIERLPEKWETVLQPISSVTPMGYLEDGPLKTEMEKIDHYTGISGGEKQRLAASRAFMRLKSGKIKLVIVDEPTSAMDPVAEFELFEKLRAQQVGRTMICVTHRFGHLTKHADLILCVDHGKIVEYGKHDDLLRSDGPYAKLYKVQADGFA
ncbi:hypothetical protein PHLGIDRAFT_254518 [Phlebiopsis gigantea 11061_1 CR5-6]|uniref:ABC transporter domain-containing protein n=1 Tax=Phlebiopsis gigantea (strain 11061_1 CR5-6) TaxID=745531 RepID=A0A0C3S1I6_PHLG1|nr:hypothetical protein PHLGIDRAFT_254518 [Phlebiopsis gigantea 11061_1 CR5-6]